MNAMERPAGMTFEHPNSTAIVKGCKTPKPVFVDGSWFDSFSKVRDWDGVWCKTHHWKSGEVVDIQDGCDTQIEWMLLERGEFSDFTSPIFPWPKYRFFVAYNRQYTVKVLTIEEDGTRHEFIVGNTNQWKTEMVTYMEKR